MDIILKLTIRQMKRSRKRTISSIAGISAATAVLCIAVAFIGAMLSRLERLDGVTAEELSPLFGAASVIVAVVMAVLVLFIYHMLSVSSGERTRYLGMLGSIGATPHQRGKMVLLEALITGGAGIIPGIVVGLLISTVLFSFEAISWKWILLVFLCEWMAVFVASLLPAWRSGRGSIIELIKNKTEKRNFRRPAAVPAWVGEKLGVEAHFAVKNIILFKRRYLMSGLIIILSMVLFWNGYIYVNYQDGGYEIQDNRPKSQADLVIEEEPEKRNAKWEQFAAGIAELPEVEECVRREQIDLGGVLLKEENIRDVIKEFQAFELAGSYQNPGKAIDTDGREKSGYLMNLILVAMDHSAFEGYLRNAGITEYSLQNKEIPVLIGDYPLVSSGGGFFYEPVLKVENNGMLSVWGDQGHSMNCPYSEENPVKGFEEWEFRVLGITSQAPPCYDVAQNVMEDSNTLRFYTTYEGLERFREIHGISENTDSTRLVAIRIKNGRYALTENLLCPTTVQSSGTIRRELKISLSKRSAWTDPKIREALHVRSDKAWEVMREIAEIGNGYGMTDPTDSSLMMSSAMDYCYNFYAAQVLGKLSDPFPMLRHMLLYGILVFLVIICIFQTTKTIAAGIQIRQKEFAVFLSLGMTKKQIAKMVCIENLLCMFGSFIVGLVISGLSGGLMFWTWENSQPIEVRYPAGLVPVEIGFLIVLVVFAVCMTVKNVKTVKMLDIIRDDLA